MIAFVMGHVSLILMREHCYFSYKSTVRKLVDDLPTKSVAAAASNFEWSSGHGRNYERICRALHLQTNVCISH